MLKFHIIIIKFSIFTDKNSQSDTFFPNLKNSIVKIDIKSFSVCLAPKIQFSYYFLDKLTYCNYNFLLHVVWVIMYFNNYMNIFFNYTNSFIIIVS